MLEAPDGHLVCGRGNAWRDHFLLYIIVPKGFFPVQDTGIIQGISEAPESISFPAMAERQQELTKVILQDPAVESLSSFIGVDGTNTTLNSGRILINLKPLEDRGHQRLGRDPAAAAGTGQGGRHHAVHAARAGLDGGRPREPHAVSIHAGRSDQNELNIWTARFVDKLKQLPELRDVATDQQTAGWRPAW